MSKDIFNFWSEIPDDAYEHPQDQGVLRRLDHGFAKDCLPCNYLGPLKTAKVVLLFLSPGLDADDVRHCSDAAGREYYANQRKGTAFLPSLKEHKSAHKWLVKILNQFEVEYEDARSTVALLNIGAYKSEVVRDKALLLALPSSRVCLDWAQTVLFPEAERGDRVVVCLRSANSWGLGIGEPIGKGLFRPRFTRSGFMHRGQRDVVVAAVQNAVREGKTAS